MTPQTLLPKPAAQVELDEDGNPVTPEVDDAPQGRLRCGVLKKVDRDLEELEVQPSAPSYFSRRRINVSAANTAVATIK